MSKMIEKFTERSGITKKGGPTKLREAQRGCYASLSRRDAPDVS